jgi:hypothetical protein
MVQMTKSLFLSGIGCSLELYPVPHVYIIQRPFGPLTDAQRLASDWHRVGHALYSAMNTSKPGKEIVKEENEPATAR